MYNKIILYLQIRFFDSARNLQNFIVVQLRININPASKELHSIKNNFMKVHTNTYWTFKYNKRLNSTLKNAIISMNNFYGQINSISFINFYEF